MMKPQWISLGLYWYRRIKGICSDQYGTEMLKNDDEWMQSWMIPVTHWNKIKARPSRSMSNTVGKAESVASEWRFCSPFSSTDWAHNSKMAKVIKGCQHNLIGLSDLRLKGVIDQHKQCNIDHTITRPILWEKIPHRLLRIAFPVHPVLSSTQSLLIFSHRYWEYHLIRIKPLVWFYHRYSV